jgi:hypothetical protein
MCANGQSPVCGYAAKKHHKKDSDGKVWTGITNTTNTTKRCGGRNIACNVSATKNACTIRVKKGAGAVPQRELCGSFKRMPPTTAHYKIER